jgi:hypothetical protein
VRNLHEGYLHSYIGEGILGSKLSGSPERRKAYLNFKLENISSAVLGLSFKEAHTRHEDLDTSQDLTAIQITVILFKSAPNICGLRACDYLHAASRRPRNHALRATLVFRGPGRRIENRSIGAFMSMISLKISSSPLNETRQIRVFEQSNLQTV